MPCFLLRKFFIFAIPTVSCSRFCINGVTRPVPDKAQKQIAASGWPSAGASQGTHDHEGKPDDKAQSLRGFCLTTQESLRISEEPIANNSSNHHLSDARERKKHSKRMHKTPAYGLGPWSFWQVFQAEVDGQEHQCDLTISS